MPRPVPFLVLAFLAAGAPLGAQGNPRIDSLMSARERSETGLARMSPTERAAFERWLARYTSAAVAGAMRATAGRTVPEARPAPRDSDIVIRPGRRAAPRPPRAEVGAVVEVTSVMSGGSYLVLSDATMWEVWSADLTHSTRFQPGDRLRVRSQPAPPSELYDLRFENGRTGGLVNVRYAGTTAAAVAIESSTDRADALGRYTIFRSASYGGAAVRGAVTPYYDCWWLDYAYRQGQHGNTFYGGDVYVGPSVYVGGGHGYGGYGGYGGHGRYRGRVHPYDYGYGSFRYYGGGSNWAGPRGPRGFDPPNFDPQRNVGVRGNGYLAPFPTISPAPGLAPRPTMSPVPTTGARR